MRFNLIFIICLIISLSLWFTSPPVKAEENNNDNQTNGVPFDASDTFSGWAEMKSNNFYLAGQTATPLAIAVNVVNTALLFLGLISAGFIMYGGLTWFLARDNEDQIKKALDIIKGAVIGLFLVLMAYSIAYLLWDLLTNSTFQY